MITSFFEVVCFLKFLFTRDQVNASPITKITSWFKFLGKNLYLVGCVTVCNKLRSCWSWSDWGHFCKIILAIFFLLRRGIRTDSETLKNYQSKRLRFFFRDTGVANIFHYPEKIHYPFKSEFFKLS